VQADTARRKQLARVCPVPASAEDLDAAADLVTSYPRSAPVVRRFNQFDKETRNCRSLPIGGGA
jgi:hypothetical protein